MTIPAPVRHSIQTLQEWLKELRDKGELADEAAAYSVLRSVLHCPLSATMRQPEANLRGGF